MTLLSVIIASVGDYPPVEQLVRGEVDEGFGPGQKKYKLEAYAISEFLNCHIFLASRIIFIQNLEVV